MNSNDILASTNSLAAQQETTLPRYVTAILLMIFMLSSLIQLDKLLDEARLRDQALDAKAIQWDDWEYQVLAVNLMHGEGFTEQYKLDYDQYNIYNAPELLVNLEFFRTPGFPAMLALDYAIFGEETINARYMMAFLKWLTAILLLVLGGRAFRPYGLVLGAVVGVYYLHFHPMLPVERIMTEIPTTFLVVLVALVLVIYLDTRKLRDLVLFSITLTILIFVRSNFMVLMPLLVIYLWLTKISLRHLAILIMIVAIPIILWSVYASVTEGKLIIMTVQSSFQFPQTNNLETLEGIGPDRIGQGGFLSSVFEKYTIEPGENGWAIGLKFWRDNLDQLPRLFFVKLRTGSWYFNAQRALNIEGLQLSGIGMLLVALGLRQPQQPPRFLPAFQPEEILRIQIALVAMLFLMSNFAYFQLILLAYMVIALIAILRPYGVAYQLPFRPPLWFLPFIGAQLIGVMLYMGVARFRYPLDGIMLLITLVGILTITLELAKRNVWLGWMFLGLAVAAYLPQDSTLFVYLLVMGVVFIGVLLIPLFQAQHTRPRFALLGAVSALVVLQLWGASFREPVIRAAYYPMLFRLFPDTNMLRNWGFNETDYAVASQLYNADGTVLNIQVDFRVPDRGNVSVPANLPPGIYERWLGNPLPGYLKREGIDYIFIHQEWWDTLGERQRELINDPTHYTRISLLYNTHTEFNYGFYRLENSDLPPEPVYGSGKLSVFLEANNTYALYRIENGQGVYLIHLDPANLTEEPVITEDGWKVELALLEDSRVQVKIFDPDGILRDDGFILEGQ